MTAAQILLKAATRLAIQAAGGPEAAALALGVSRQAVDRYHNQNHREFIPLAQVPVLEAAGPSMTITAALAQLCGATVLPLAGALDRADFCTRVGAISRETGDVLAEAGAAMADGALTTGERARLARQAFELRAAADALLAVLEGRAP